MPTFNHEKTVDDWLRNCPQDLDSESLYDLFYLTFNGIWYRAKRALGEITLMAIGDYALRTATERYPLLGPLKLEQDGIRRAELRTKAAGYPPEDVKNAMSFALSQFLTVLGSLTAELLTPTLHAELSATPPCDGRAAPPVESRGDGGKEETS
jgi:hypothetical protein